MSKRACQPSTDMKDHMEEGLRLRDDVHNSQGLREDTTECQERFCLALRRMRPAVLEELARTSLPAFNPGAFAWYEAHYSREPDLIEEIQCPDELATSFAPVRRWAHKYRLDRPWMIRNALEWLNDWQLEQHAAQSEGRAFSPDLDVAVPSWWLTIGNFPQDRFWLRGAEERVWRLGFDSPNSIIEECNRWVRRQLEEKVAEMLANGYEWRKIPANLDRDAEWTVLYVTSTRPNFKEIAKDEADKNGPSPLSDEALLVLTEKIGRAVRAFKKNADLPVRRYTRGGPAPRQM